MEKHQNAIIVWKYGRYAKAIGQKVKEWRKVKGVTQDALAKKADLQYTTLTKIESNVIQNPDV